MKKRKCPPIQHWPDDVFRARVHELMEQLETPSRYSMFDLVEGGGRTKPDGTAYTAQPVGVYLGSGCYRRRRAQGW